MANITVTAASVAVVFPSQCEIYNVKLAEAVTKGQALYQTVSGTYGVAQANLQAKCQIRGLALEAANSGEGISMLKRGIVAGFTLATYEDIVYLSDTAGRLSTTSGTRAVVVGHVMDLADPALTEVLYFEADWLREW